MCTCKTKESYESICAAKSRADGANPPFFVLISLFVFAMCASDVVTSSGSLCTISLFFIEGVIIGPQQDVSVHVSVEEADI